MARFYLSRVALLGVAIVMAFSMLAACGGGDDDDGGNGGGDFPTPSGAERLGEEDANADDIDAGDVDISDAKAIAYKVSDSNMDDVADFYENGVEDDGWTVDEHVALGELMLSVMHNGDELAITTAMTGSAAREQGAAELGDLTVDLDELEDDDILIVAATFTCNEESIEDCITAMELGLEGGHGA
jgi:hypothetical protein